MNSNLNLSPSEEKIVTILKSTKSDNIWTSIQEVVDISKMDMVELETTLYFLQVKGVIRVSVDEYNSFKLTTEEQVSDKLSKRISDVTADMSKVMLEAVDDEDFEEAAVLRDWISDANSGNNLDSLVDSILDGLDIESEDNE